MLNFFRANLVFLVVGFILAEAFKITTWEYWIWFFTLIISFELRDQYLKSTHNIKDL